jgi:aminopeptidase S
MRIGSSADVPGTHMRSTLVLLLAALLGGCAAAPPTLRAPEDDRVRRFAAEVSGAGALPHLQALQRIADANGGNRASPGPGYDASVDYVAGVLRYAGYDVSTPTYSVSVGRRGDDRQEVALRQVIAQTRTGDPAKVVMAGAHLDSVPDGPGINDNGSGVAALLEIATRLGGSPEVSNAVRFGFWGSEEEDLDGSTSYVQSLSGPERDGLVLYLNLDMLASPNAGYFVQGGEGRRSSQTGPPGSAAVAKVLTDQLAMAGIAAEPATFDDGSDYAAFVAAGIPSGGVLTGDEDDKTVREARSWGGRAGEAYDHCYHSACDRLDDLDTAALDHNTDAVAGTLAHFAMSTAPLPV